jgi:hypothetical protein
MKGAVQEKTAETGRTPLRRRRRHSAPTTDTYQLYRYPTWANTP